MSDPYVGEIRIFSGNYAPDNWHVCDGSLLSVRQYEALFAVIGTTYGGNGATSFALPDLGGRAPLHMGQGPGLSYYLPGAQAGVETVALTAATTPAHSHGFNATSNPANTGSPANAYLANTSAVTVNKVALLTYDTATDTPAPTAQLLNPNAVAAAGNSQPHNNLMPSIGLTMMICLLGVFPQQPT
jgi:microcystin-dependent protein